jgi:negative regulator of sigma E activity
MTTAIVHYRRPWLPALALLLAAAAVVVAVIALAMAPNDNSDAIRQAQLGRVVTPVPASAPVRTPTNPVVNVHHDRSLGPIIECGRRLPARC